MASEQSLRKIQEEVDKLNLERDQMKTIIKTSVACQDLIKFIDETPEPFGSQVDNPWATKAKKGGCVVQ